MGRPTKAQVAERTALAIQESQQGEVDRFAGAITKLQDEIVVQFPAKLVETIKKIAYEISVIGLTEKEACVISDYPFETWIELKQKFPIVQRLVELKDLEYKRNLLKSVSARAGTDDKLAMWMLEARYPEEFNRRKGSGKDGEKDPQDLVGMAIEFVRKSGDSSGLVSEESGRAFIIKTKDGKPAELKSVSEILA